ncbi:L-rhamnose operon regulatory protein RhaS [Anaerohalosphaera lusitana]|uniref:L-rhamnose operon regulatory protein RhaS n=1 Tax=Anaerohalosphaera lusitana TaxID=1936003 RepID=A0A1U9NLD2_9BACT|nr:AraC family transcriptional regulator [Anaerohalosphaera lusitana]AQT68741.1 L-rhamnose operon regulatory protein RhaS [Anaerohalosphaera lusitana]
MTDLSGNIRKKFEQVQCLSDRLRQLGWASFTKPVRDRENLPRHVHPDTFEICCIASGNVEWWVEGQIYNAKAGDLFITLPGESHGGLNDIMNPCELYWAQIQLQADTGIGGLKPDELKTLKLELIDAQCRVFTGSAKIEQAFAFLISEHEKPDRFARAKVETTLAQLLIEVARACQAGHANQISPTIQRACDMINAAFNQPIRMEEIARELGLNLSAFYKQFAEQLHEKPTEYLTRLRIAHAKELLRQTDQTITQIAHASGYSSSQYFATIFKRSTGLSPRIYRKNVKTEG